MEDMSTPEPPACFVCGEEFSQARRELKYNTCLKCGEKAAKEERSSWCVIQEYGKGAYQLVTPTTALTSLKQTNQKNLRS